MNVPKLFQSLDHHRQQCLLCPHYCTLSPGMHGKCKVRTADESGINALRRPVSVIAVDPIEKKPFYHYLPGTHTLSIGFTGCNMNCPFCQNHSLVDSNHLMMEIDPQYILNKAMELNLPSVSFTYSEPLIHAEFLIETAELLKKNKIAALLVTNGCINREPGRWLLSFLDGVKVDLKSFNPTWYRNELGGNLETVKDFIIQAAEMTHLEIVSLIVPGKNDLEQEISESTRFISLLNKNIPFHLTAYYPQFKYTIPSTSKDRINLLRTIALKNLNYVYTGNIGSKEDIHCPVCGTLVVNRNWGTQDLSQNNQCRVCSNLIYGRFNK